MNTIFKALEKIRKLGYLSQDTLNYFLVKDPNLGGFIYYLKSINGYMISPGDQ